MRKRSEAVRLLMKQDNVSIFYLIMLRTETLDLKHTSLPFDVTIDGLGTFNTDNGLMGVDAPRLSAVVDREAYKVTYSDNDFEFRNIFEDGIAGGSLTVYIGFYNTLDYNLSGFAPGMPITNKEDLIISYKGVVDSHTHTITPDEDVVAVIEGASPMASLALKKTFITSQDQIRQKNSNDTAFDQVYSGSQTIQIHWGKS